MKEKKGIVVACIAAIAIAGVMIWRMMGSAPEKPADALIQKNAELVKDTPANPSTADASASTGSRRVPRKP